MKRKSKGQPKKIETDIVSFSFNGVADQYASFHYSDERFDRPLKDIYKFVLCHSYREKGKSKKKQFVLFSVDYYWMVSDFYCLWDCLEIRKGTDREKRFNELKKVIGLSDEEELTELYDYIESEVEPIRKKVVSEYQQSEEYKTDKANDAIIRKHQKKEKEFDCIYGDGNYKRCYNVFGELWNEQKLEEIKRQYEAQERYKKQYSSYSSGWESNYNSYGYSNTISIPAAYSEDEKSILKKMYKKLAIEFHPDKPNGDEAAMKLVNRFKEEWGV